MMMRVTSGDMPLVTRIPTFEEQLSLRGTLHSAHIFIMNARIHEDMPEFTFIRTVIDEHMDDPSSPFPRPVEVSIEILNEEGETIQTIEGLRQSAQGGNAHGNTHECS